MGEVIMKVTIESVPGERAVYLTKNILSSINDNHPKYVGKHPREMLSELNVKIRRVRNKVIRTIQT